MRITRPVPAPAPFRPDAPSPSGAAAADEAGEADRTDPAAPAAVTAANLHAGLAATFGEATTRATLQALGLDAQNPRALTAAEIGRATEAARTSQVALSGLNFLSQALLSASSGTPLFRECAAIDAAFARDMAAASANGRHCVDLPAAQILMQHAIERVLTDPI